VLSSSSSTLLSQGLALTQPPGGPVKYLVKRGQPLVRPVRDVYRIFWLRLMSEAPQAPPFSKRLSPSIGGLLLPTAQDGGRILGVVTSLGLGSVQVAPFNVFSLKYAVPSSIDWCTGQLEPD
jgi:hypothetical protein